MLPIKRISPARRARHILAAARSPLANREVHYPDWYLHRWHFLPEGYLSRRGAALYEHVIQLLYWELSARRAFDMVVRALRASEAHTVLDIGCGPGTLLGTLREQLPGARVAGVDLSPYMLERAMRRAPQADLVHADAVALPWPDGTFAAVTACHVLGHVPGEAKRAIAAETERVLATGGVAVVVDHPWHGEPIAGMVLLARRRLAAGLLELRVYRKWAAVAGQDGIPGVSTGSLPA